MADEDGWLAQVMGWSIKKLICYVALTISIGSVGGAVVSVIVIPWVDQWARNKVDGWMSGPDLFDFLSISREQYHGLPLRWRQALAEIAVRDSPASADLKELVRTLDADDVRLLDKVAPYVLDMASSGGVVRHSVVGTYPHKLPGLVPSDFGILESLGIVESSGYTWSIDRNWLVVGTGTALAVFPRDSQEVPVRYTKLTDIGTDLVLAAGRHTDLAYLKWVAQVLEEDGRANAELWVLEENQERPPEAMEWVVPSDNFGQIDRDTITAID